MVSATSPAVCQFCWPTTMLFRSAYQSFASPRDSATKVNLRPSESTTCRVGGQAEVVRTRRQHLWPSKRCLWAFGGRQVYRRLAL